MKFVSNVGRLVLREVSFVDTRLFEFDNSKNVWLYEVLSSYEESKYKIGDIVAMYKGSGEYYDTRFKDDIGKLSSFKDSRITFIVENGIFAVVILKEEEKLLLEYAPVNDVEEYSTNVVKFDNLRPIGLFNKLQEYKNFIEEKKDITNNQEIKNAVAKRQKILSENEEYYNMASSKLENIKK